jgi:hypothetical protein
MKIQDYPKQIEQASLDLAVTCETLSELREQLKDAEVEALAEVIGARSEDNKPIHSNDKARDIALHRALRANDAYQRERSSERILEHKKAALEAEVERLRREYRIALIDYERAELGRRDAA